MDSFRLSPLRGENPAGVIRTEAEALTNGQHAARIVAAIVVSIIVEMGGKYQIIKDLNHCGRGTERTKSCLFEAKESCPFEIQQGREASTGPRNEVRGIFIHLHVSQIRKKQKYDNRGQRKENLSTTKTRAKGKQ